MEGSNLHLCEPESMHEREGWSYWARILQQWGVKEPVAAGIEAAGALSVIFAQAIYVGQPFLKWINPDGQWSSLADTLEDRGERQAFVFYLRSKESV